MTPSSSFSRIVQDFFRQHLVGERDLSSNTVLSYRDCMRLLLKSVGRSVGRSADMITLEDFDASRVRAFLTELERERNCSSNTRNQRLAASRHRRSPPPFSSFFDAPLASPSVVTR